HQLRCPPGTVSSRLARARERLRVRLSRRGLAVSSVALAATLLRLPAQASAVVPRLLEAATVRGALRFSSGNLGSGRHPPARVVSLATWCVRSLGLGKLRLVGGLLVLFVLGGSLLVLFLWLHQPNQQPVENRSLANSLQGTWTVTSMNMGGIPIP